MAERGIALAHTTILRWVQPYVPQFEKRWSRYARKALAIKRSAAAARRAWRKKEVDRRTGGVDSPVQIYPLALNPDVGLIHLPAVVGQSEPRSQSALNFWGVTLDPPPDDDVVDQKSALGKEFLNVTVGQ